MAVFGWRVFKRVEVSVVDVSHMPNTRKQAQKDAVAEALRHEREKNEQLAKEKAIAHAKAEGERKRAAEAERQVC